MDVIGIDISKADFHAYLIQGSRNAARSFPNGPSGYRQLWRWLRNRGTTEVHACMEATGSYWMGLATALFENGLRVSVVNPSRTAMFARSQLLRTKTDKVDAQMIAEFCQTQQPKPWTPPSPQSLELRGLLSYRQQLVRQRIGLKQIANEVHVGAGLQALHTSHLKSVDDAIDALEAQILAILKANPELEAQVARLTSIKGFGLISAVALVAKLPIDRLRDGKAAAAYVGLSPRERQSGTSVRGKPRICKTGDAELRRDLYMPAIVAMRYNPTLSAFAARLKERGKPSKVIIVAVMRKLVVLAYQLLKDPSGPKIAVPA